MRRFGSLFGTDRFGIRRNRLHDREPLPMKEARHCRAGLALGSMRIKCVERERSFGSALLGRRRLGCSTKDVEQRPSRKARCVAHRAPFSSAPRPDPR